jgi:hypothetical protein
MEVGSAYLRARGLDLSDIDANKVEILPAQAGAERVGWLRPPNGAQAAIVFRHYGTRGQRLNYETVRFPGSTGAKLVAPKAAPKLFFPPSLDWKRIPSGVELQIHESAIKAMNAAKLGAWAVGLNGVWCWGSEGALLEDWDALDLVGKLLKPTIVFDSNNNLRGHAYNPRVRDAAVRLSCKLRIKYGERVNVFLRQIAEDPDKGAKGWGFDDWCVRDRPAVVQWLAQPAQEFNIDPWTEAVSELNDEVTYVADLKRVATLAAPHIFMTPNEFSGGAYANRHYEDAGGERKPAARAWITSPARNEVRTLVYRPGQPKMESRQWLNLWNGMGCEAEGGEEEAQPFLDLLANLFPNPAEREELLAWMAYPLQNLGAKMHKALLVVGESGVGKSFVAETLSMIYGGNAKKVRNKDFQTNFNSNLAQTQFGVWEEATLMGRSKADTDSALQNLKDFVTGHTLPVEFKGKDVVHVENCCNLMILTNAWDKFPIQRGERRIFALEAKPVEDKKHDSAYWKALIAWRAGNGAQALYGYLLGLNISKYEPHAPAMQTDALAELHWEGSSARVAWIEDTLHTLGMDLMTAAEIEATFQASGINRDHEAGAGGAKAMSSALKECGVPLAAGGEKMRAGSVAVARWYNVRRQQKYTSKAICQAYLANRGDVKLDNFKF